MTDLPLILPVSDPRFARAIGAQTSAANPLRSAWVEANAGSGKTKVLIDRVARLLLRRPDGRDGSAPDSILCVTYTKAAANEMLSRLYERLGNWSIATDEALRKELSRLESRAPEAYSASDLREARSLFARALETPGGLRIETLHAFCARILRRFPLEAGISPGFTELEDDEADRLWRAVLSERLPVIALENEDALITISQAAGGRGVTAAIEALRPHRSALFAFMRSLAASGQDLEPHIRAALKAPSLTSEALLDQAMGPDLPRSRLEGLADVLEHSAKPAAKDLKLAGAIRAACSDSPPRARWAMYSSALRTSKGWVAKNPYGAAHRSNANLVDLFQVEGDLGLEAARIHQVDRDLRAAEVAERTIALMQIGLPLLEAYQDEKHRRAALDFDDLIQVTRALLTNSEAAPWVLYKLDGGLSHILLDEAQDTSPAQWDLVNALVEEFMAGAGQTDDEVVRTQFVVGDPKQSIYSFQGADQQHFVNEQLGFRRRQEVVEIDPNMPDMTMSFRSSPEILTFVDEVRATVPLDNAATDALPPRDADLLPHQSFRAGQGGRVELWPLVMPEPSTDTASAWKAPVDYQNSFAPRRWLASEVAETVAKMIRSGEAVWGSGPGGPQKRALTAEDILILVQRRNDLFDALIEELKKQGLRVAGADRLSLLENLGVQDCLNLIRFAIQPGDDLVLAEILRGPFCGFVDDDHMLFPLAHGRAKGQSLWDRLREATDVKFEAAKRFCETLLEHRALGAYEFLNRALTVRQEDGRSGWDCMIQRMGEPVRDPIRALLDRALRIDMSAPASLQAFLSEIEGSATELKRDLGEPDGAIRVMTVHGAKGLQAPIVILPDTTAGTRKPGGSIFFTADGTPIYATSAAADSDIAEQARDMKIAAAERESRRLLYVALTRAQDRLIICGAGMRAPKIGYAKSSWYRWCLTAMRGLTEDAVDLDTQPLPPEEILALGAEPTIIETQVTEKPEPVSPTAWLYKDAADQPPPRRLSAPSTLLEDKSQVHVPLSANRQYSLRRGRVIHSLLQVLSDLPAARRQDAASSLLDRAKDLEPDQKKEIKDVTFRTLNDPVFSDIFGPGGRNEAAIIGTLENGLAINGRVDRLQVLPDHILIIDYKTDRPAPEQASDVDASYVTQMGAYQSILKQIYGVDRPVKCALLYTDGPRLIKLSDDILLESLNRLNSAV